MFRWRATNQVASAIKRGELPRPDEFLCSGCENVARVYDHRDYEMPLDVAPVCGSCNYALGSAVQASMGAVQHFWVDDDVAPAHSLVGKNTAYKESRKAERVARQKELKEYMAREGINANSLALRLGVSRQRISQILNAK